MTRTERILEETERTLRSWEDDATLTADPFLATRIPALHRERIASGWRAFGPFLQVRYAVMLALLAMNLVTALYLELSPRQDLSKDLVSQLRDDLQIDPSPDNP